MWLLLQPTLKRTKEQSDGKIILANDKYPSEVWNCILEALWYSLIKVMTVGFFYINSIYLASFMEVRFPYEIF